MGGMATVWRATDTLLGRQLAIKRLSPHLTSDQAASERFRREAQAAARLNHPGILTVFDAGEDDDGPWIAMELIEGETLADRLAAHGPMDLVTVASITDQVAAAVDYAHKNGVIHRDIKPANLIIEPGGRLRLADFGIAKPVDDPATITLPGEMVGTISYLAPEIVAGEASSPSSDIYSLAAVVYEMLTGEKPFTADTTAGLLEIIRSADGPVLAGKVPPQVVPALSRAMSRDPSKRPETAQAFALELGQHSTLVLPVGVIEPNQPPAAVAIAKGGSDEPTVVMSSATNDGGGESTGTVMTESGGPGRTPSRRMMAVAVGLVLLVLITALGMAGGDPSDKEQGVQDGSTPTTESSTTTSGAPTTTTVSTTVTEETPASLAAEIGDLLDRLRPPEYKPKDVKEVEDRVYRAIEHWEQDDREESAKSMEDAFKSISRFPESDARDALFALLVRLAEAMGFEVERDD